jgi:hypothetical protein
MAESERENLAEYISQRITQLSLKSMFLKIGKFSFPNSCNLKISVSNNCILKRKIEIL